MDEIATNHHGARAWNSVVDAIAGEIDARAVHPARTVVLVPFAQLMPVARAAWIGAAARSGQAAGFLPRFESTMNWARALGALPPGGDDLRMDAAHDVLTAASLMDRAGLGRKHHHLAGHLMQAAWSLARVAAAVAPGLRSRWGADMAAALDDLSQDPVLATEAWLGRIALAWAASSSYSTDILFTADVELLVVLEGFQPEPLHAALAALHPERTCVVRLPQQSSTGAMQLHQALDAEDEAQRAAACVLVHLHAGRQPVALVAQDRLLTRRVRAMLSDRGVVIRDETGWTLSTTRAAASVMSLLRAATWNASSDAVLEWVKGAPVFQAPDVAEFETELRRIGVSEWHRVQLQGPIPQAVLALRLAMEPARPLADWLGALRGVMVTSGQWSGLLDDVAGQAVVDALRLREGSAAEFAALTRPISHAAFVAWVGQALESGSFVPPHPAAAQVMILPLSQLLGRTPAAVVFPGCDEIRLPASPEPPDIWTPAQRLVLGLPTRDQLALAGRAAWRHALQFPWLDLLWRQSEGGEHLMPGVWMLELLQHHAVNGPDARLGRLLPTQPCHMPAPAAGKTRLRRLSASSYDDLRSCPYRFFALRLLGLREQDELASQVDKRDFGNWLHLVLRHFHDSLHTLANPSDEDRARLIDVAADKASAALGLSEAEFLPFAATWPQVRAAYLKWQAAHESGGARFEAAELALEQPLGDVSLVGRIDRIDRLPDGSRLVIDYKTESRKRTTARLKQPTEDTQLAFYAALVDDDAPAAMYLSLVENDAAKSCDQPDIVHLRDQLVDSILDDMRRITQGHPLAALGAGTACEYCAARGLCRQDFWATPARAPAVVTDV